MPFLIRLITVTSKILWHLFDTWRSCEACPNIFLSILLSLWIIVCIVSSNEPFELIESIICGISGHNGTIDGQGKMWWELWWNRTLQYTRGHLLELMNSNNILISNLTFLNSPFWTIHPVYCRCVLFSLICSFYLFCTSVFAYQFKLLWIHSLVEV